MSDVDRNRLRSIHTFEELVEYLREELDWPVQEADFDELTFDYEPSELGIDEKTASKIEEIKQLRPLSSDQPWGIFFIKFEPRRLPVVALRRILRSLVVKKRASASQSDRAVWEKHDLLFISNYGEEDHKQITFAHFSDNQEHNDRDVLKVLGWDNDDTVLTLDHVHDELKSKLAWPEDQSDLESWRSRWRSAFTREHRQVINDSKQLAQRLAELATVIRKRCNAALRIENDNGPITSLMNAFKAALLHDLTPDDFADTYAQTIAYGLLSARASKEANFTADNLVDLVPVTNPFLKELLKHFLDVGGRRYDEDAGRLVGIDFDELGVNDVVDMLRGIDVKHLLRNFGNRDLKEDPVIYFYEDFLEAYDGIKRKMRGVYYTPRAVVGYIVRSVHELLQTELGLEDGLADTTTWGEMLEKHPDLELPTTEHVENGKITRKPIDPSTPFVQILDPATGTATFLVEIIDLIHETMVAKWKKEGHGDLWVLNKWNEYVPKHLLPRLHGYELMMAPYAIAHMKIGLKLFETGYKFGDDERARVYLTNALEPVQDFAGEFEQMVPALAHEAEAVNQVKKHTRFTVITGNPPYAGLSSNMTPWIDGLLKGKLPDGTKTDSYYHVDGEPLGERKVWLQDDYVKFTRYSQSLLKQTGVGVHGFITNHGFIDNPTFRGMRWSLMDTFDGIRVLDLHGNLKKKEAVPGGGKDINVFDIQQGVSIGLFVRGVERDGAPGKAAVRHADLWGEREQKYRWLEGNSVGSSKWQDMPTAEPFYLFEPFNQSEAGDYIAWPAISDVMPVNVTGIVTARDDFVIDFDDESLRQRMVDLRDTTLSDQDVRQKYFAGKGSKKYPAGDSRGWKLPAARDRIRSDDQWDERYAPILYRPFDTRRIYYVPWMVDWARTETMPHMLAGENLAIITARSNKFPEPDHFFASKTIVETKCGESSTQSATFPLYVYPDVSNANESLLFDHWPEGKNGRRPNLDPDFIEFLDAATGLEFISDGCGDLDQTFGPGDVLGFIYAAFHSPEYRRRFEPMLKLDFPRIPTPGGRGVFADLARLGRQLLDLHLLESPVLIKPTINYDGPTKPEVGRVGWQKDGDGKLGTVWLDATKTDAKAGQIATKPGTYGFHGVPEDVWRFHIGGYQVCHKWLKDRKGRTLSQGDLEHYQKIVVALKETIRLMAEIDEAINAHGGWLDAFATAAAAGEGDTGGQ